MSENLNGHGGGGEPEGGARGLSEEGAESRGQVSPTSSAAEQAFPPSEAVVPEAPAAPFQESVPAYPPPPEYYKQLPPADTSGTPPPSAPLSPPPAYNYGYTPPPPAYGYGHTPPPPDQPLPLGQAMRDLPRQYKKILLKPGVRSFVEEQGKAGWGIIWSQLLFTTALQILVSIPFFISYNQFLFTTMSSVGPAAGAEIYLSPAFLIFEIVLAAIFTPLIFFTEMGIQYLLARAFKGIGSFKRQAYNQLLFQVPIGVISAAFSFIFSTYIGRNSSMLPVTTSTTTVTSSPNALFLLVILLADLVVLGLSVYSIVLNVFSLMATHRLSGGRATAAVLIPIGAVILLAFLCIGALVAVSTVTISSSVQ